MERGAVQVVSFVVQIILARLLMPNEFGTIALLNVMMLVLNVFITYGFGNSLVVDKESDTLDFSTCLFFGIFLSIVTYVIVFFLSPFISVFFFETTDLGILIKVMALTLPISAINSVQYAYIAKRMQFNLSFKATLIGTIISGGIGIIMAYLGFGVWSLIAQYLSNSLLCTLTLSMFSDWRPIWAFSFQRLRKIYDYGWKILGVGLIDMIFGQILVIAKKYTRNDLAYYNRGTSFPSVCMSFFEPTINDVLFPALSNCNNNQEMMKTVTRRVVKSSMFIVCGLISILLVIAKPLVLFLLTEKWIDCVIFLQIGCVAYLFRPLQVINNCVIRASGRSGLLLKLDLLKKGIGLILLLLSMQYGVIAIAWSLAITNIVSTLVNIYPNIKILNYGYLEQLKDILGILVVGGLTIPIVWSISMISESNFLMLILQSSVGLTLYCVIAQLLKLESFLYLKEFVFEFILKYISR